MDLFEALRVVLQLAEEHVDDGSSQGHYLPSTIEDYEEAMEIVRGFIEAN